MKTLKGPLLTLWNQTLVDQSDDMRVIEALQDPDLGVQVVFQLFVESG